MFSRRGYMSLAILAIIVPMSILASSRLAGILQSPLPLQTIMADTVYWNISRPQETVDFHMVDIRNSYKDTALSVDYTIVQTHYLENHPGIDGLDGLLSLVIVNATATNGTVESVLVKFEDFDENETVIIDIYAPTPLYLSGLILSNLNYGGYAAFGKNASIEMRGTNSAEAFMETSLYWLFIDNNDQDHWMTATLEITYHTNTTRFKVILPINLGVLVT